MSPDLFVRRLERMFNNIWRENAWGIPESFWKVMIGENAEGFI